MSKEQLKLAADEAAAAFDVIQAERDTRQREARERIAAEYADRMQSAWKVREAARKAYLEAVSNEASHPWDGKRVYKMVTIRSRFNSAPIREQRVEGLVEVVRLDSRFAGNLSSYSRPRLGSVIVRKIKKDGTPSLQLVQGFHIHGLDKEWKLAEDDGNA